METDTDDFVAHRHADGRVHPLAEHLAEVGRLVGQFSGDGATRAIARLAGLWHDLGKYRPGFQRYLRLVVDRVALVPGASRVAAPGVWLTRRC